MGCLKFTYPNEYGAFNEAPIFHLPYLGEQSTAPKKCEKWNHLGNVLTVISDKPIPHVSTGTTVDYFMADIIQSSDYSAFGCQLSGRNFVKSGAKEFRYGFGNMEEDDEIKGDGNSYDFGNRMYDSRLAKFLSLDPFATKFAYQSPYTYAGNTPIWAKDVNGDSVLFYSESGNYLGYSNDNERYEDHNLLVIIKDKDVRNFNNAYKLKRAAKVPESRAKAGTGAAYTEATVAGLEAMGTSIDVTDFIGFFDEYSTKREDASGKVIESKKDEGDMIYVEWSATINSEKINSMDEDGSVGVNESSAYTENSSNSVTLQGSDVKGFSSFHTHSSFWVDPDPSSVDKNRLNLIKGSDWNIVVGQGMFTLYKDQNPETGPETGRKQILEITLYTNQKFTSAKNKGQ